MTQPNQSNEIFFKLRNHEEHKDLEHQDNKIKNFFFRRKNAINYLQGTRVKMLTDWQVPKEPLYGLPMNVINAQQNDQRMVEIPIFRLKWIKLNAENGSLDNAIRVSVIPYHEPLNTYPSGESNNTGFPCTMFLATA